jgi:hypothetical protein
MSWASTLLGMGAVIRGRVGMARARKIRAPKQGHRRFVAADRLVAGDRQGGRLNPAIGSGLFPEMVASPDIRMAAQIGS